VIIRVRAGGAGFFTSRGGRDEPAVADAPVLETPELTGRPGSPDSGTEHICR
jgi:hypothetical protein